MCRKILSFITTLALIFVSVTNVFAQLDTGTADESTVAPFLNEQQITPDSAIADAGLNPVAELLTKDVMLVLDNSGSMKQNDPNFLTNRAVTEFITGLDESTHVGIIIFDQSVRLPVQLTQITLGSRGEILDSLNEINYQGLFTNSPAAIERAIYELKSNARDDAQKLIVFMTDGIVDTGNADEDLEKSKWLKESLASDAADNEIKIFGIAFTENADFELIQSLAQKTGGEYFRALQPENLQRVFNQIETIINTPPEPTVIFTPPPTTPTVVVPAPAPIVIVEQAPQAIGNEERIRDVIIIAAIAVLVVVVLAIFVLFLRRAKSGNVAAVDADTEAFLNDIHGYTSQPSYKLSTGPTMLGRVAGKDTDHLDYLVIPESTIGRRHSLIEYKDYAYWIIDQGSINGTYVNDVPVTSEVRLKHGDKVRLHKFEFEFVMPEMVDAGMTVISNTVLADQGGQAPAAAVDDNEETELKGASSLLLDDDEEDAELDFDLTGAGAEEVVEDNVPVEDFRGNLDETQEENVDDYDDSEEVTVMKAMPAVQPVNVDNSEDETLMPEGSSFEDDDATIRQEDDDEDLSLDNFIDLDDLDDDK
jgi:pSer/pThr/pTyr-binding forkhead associated (FHA) protein